MPIPKAVPGEEFAYDFEYAVFIKDSETAHVFLDRYRYDPAQKPLIFDGTVCLSAEDLRRIYAPYLTLEQKNDAIIMTLYSATRPAIKATLVSTDWFQKNDAVYIKAIRVMNRCFGRQVMEKNGVEVIAVGSELPVNEVFASGMAFKPYRDRLAGKTYGEQNYCLWVEEAERLIPYRMYIPFTYRAGTPQKSIVCFHGGDANADYMFKHTNNEIECYAEDYGYILLALCSYRKFTFFGASKVPAGIDNFDPADPNPCGLNEEEMKWCNIAEKSVRLQIEDAKKRYTLDETKLYAIGNSGGCLGIFQQIKVLPENFFRAVSCSGGLPSVSALNPEILSQKQTHILVLMASEDVFDGQYSFNVGYPYLKENGLNVSFHAVGGGDHLTGWTHALPYIFNFFEQCDN